MTHAPTNKKTNTPKLSAPLPAILTGLFILAGCGGTALPTNVQIETPTSADAANHLDTNAVDSIFLSVGEQPPVDTAKSAPPAETPIVQKPKQEEEEEQEEVKKQVQDPAPVFEVAVAPASPPQRSFHTEPVTETDSVMKIDTTAPQSVAVAHNTWTGSFTSPALADTADFTGNGFLSGAIYFDNTGATRVLNVGRLNLAITTFDGKAIGGDAMDGVAFFRAEIDIEDQDSEIYNYAGLLSDTNLGAPLEVSNTTATWNGSFYALVGSLAIDTDFTLNVDFSSNRTLTAVANNHFTLNNAIYNTDGVISGGITITNAGVSADGVLTGLIGQDGAVGAFHSNARGEQSYAGGFVASPTIPDAPDKVTFADWTGSFAGTLPTRAETTAVTTTTIPETITKDNGGILVTFTGKSLVNKVGDTILTYTSEVLKANGEPHDDDDPIAFTTYDDGTTNDGHIIVVSRDGTHMFSESELAYIAANAKFNGDIPVTMDNPLDAIATTTTSNTRNQFLRGLKDRLDERQREGDPNGLVAIRGSLNLATATHGGVALGGDAADGVAFFRGFGGGIYDSQTRTYYNHNYAGLLSGTDLGEPLEDTFRGKTSARWKGHIRTLGYFQFDMDFTLEVTFGTRKLNIDELKNPQNMNQTLTITHAEYDADGVISGRIIIDEEFDNFGIGPQHGFLTGLIGQEGAVAAFLSSGEDNDENTVPSGEKEDITEGFHRFGYAGGFVARPAPPHVVASDLPNYASILTTASTATGRGFLRIADDDGVIDVHTDSIDADSLLIQGRRRSYTYGKAGFDDGYTFFQGTGYVAMLPTTNLGAARPVGAGQPTDARWDGTYSLTTDSGALTLDAPIAFTINFETGAIKGTAPITTEYDQTITIETSFDADGVMSGMLYTESAGGVVPSLDSPLINAGDTSVIGLIGEEGLVGIMHGENMDDDAFAGGFVASPPE